MSSGSRKSSVSCITETPSSGLDQFYMVAEQVPSMASRLVQSAIIDDIKMWVYNPFLDSINMLQAHNTKLPLPTAFDGTSSSPPFLEWADEIRTYINLYSIDIQYEMDQTIRVNDVIHTSDIITEQDRIDQERLNLLTAVPSPTQSFIPPKENPTFWSDDSSEHHQDWRRGDNSTPSMQWSESPPAFIPEYYKWLEDIAQYAIATTEYMSEPIKIAVVLQHIKGPLVQHLKLNISADSK
eukprot:5540130-Amphidinium_carterae.1